MTYYDLNMNNKRVTNAQDPSSAQDVATKNYTDTTFKADKIYIGNSTATTANKVYYLNASSNWILADKTNSVGKMIAVAVGTNPLTDGMWAGSNPTDLVISVTGDIGSTIFLDTNGDFTTTQPSGTDLTQVRPCGYKISSTNIIFYTYNNYIMPAGLAQYGIATGAGTQSFTSSTITDPTSSLQYQLLTWKSTSGTNTMNVSTAGLFEIFILGAGGGSGISSVSGSGGGGGAGQLISSIAYLDTGNYTIVVGAGGSTGANNSESGGRGGFSAIVPTTPAYPKFIAVGGGGGMSSTNNTSGPHSNSIYRQLHQSDGWCAGGGAMPYNDNGTIVYGDYTTNSNVYAIGGDNTTTFSSFWGGTGGNNSNQSASGGGGGLSEAGQAYTGSTTNRVGGRGGNGISSGFSGIERFYGGGGGGGCSTDTGNQINTNGSQVAFTISGTNLTISGFQSGSAVGIGYRIVAQTLLNSSASRGFYTPNNIINPTPSSNSNNPITSEIFIVSQTSGTPNGIGVYVINQTFSPQYYDGATGSVLTATGLYISPYGGGQGGRNIDLPNNRYWSGSPGGYNSGSGGGGAANQNNNGGFGGIGGSGLVMVRYRV